MTMVGAGALYWGSNPELLARAVTHPRPRRIPSGGLIDRLRSRWPMTPPRLKELDADRLVAALQEGGDREEIFRQLYERYQRPVHACFARRGLAAEDCRDLTQETFLRLYRGIGNFRRQSRFETWLYEIALNVWRNEIRNRSARKRDVEETRLADERPGGGGRLLPTFDNPAQVDDLLAKEETRLLRRELEKMPPQMQRCLRLRLDQELKFREIADLMQISIETVKSQLGQAKQRIRRRLSKYFEAAPGGRTPEGAT